jgi:hypothetical protein
MREMVEISPYPRLDPETETTLRAPTDGCAWIVDHAWACTRFGRPCLSPVAVHARSLSASSRVVGEWDRSIGRSPFSSPAAVVTIDDCSGFLEQGLVRARHDRSIGPVK